MVVDGDAPTVRDGVIVLLGVRLDDAVPLMDGVGVADGIGDAVADKVTEASTEIVGVRDTVPLTDGVTVGVVLF